MKRTTAGAYGTLLAATLAILGFLGAKPEFSLGAGNPAGSGPARPVLVELFTSEGCSSCPPADRLLEKLDRAQPVPGAQIIVLSEHVDYWNRLGWADPFSSALFTERQQDYVTQLHLSDAYTPQAVIDGQKDAVGSDEPAIRAAVMRAEALPKVPIDLTAERSGAEARAHIRISDGVAAASVYVALASDHVQSHVTRGENSGRNLEHVAVARMLVAAGKTDAHGAFRKDLTLPLRGGAGDWRVIAFVQDSGFKILGSAQARLP